MRLLSTRELADALGVSESSLKRWVDAGKIRASRTEGGHRRIALSDAMRFIRESGSPVVRPELLDLPEIAVAQSRPRERFVDYLVDGDAPGARGWLTARYLEGASVASLADGPVREAMHAMGELWRHDDAGIFVEHRATDACLQAVLHLRSSLPSPAPDAPCSLGGAPAGDPYLIPTQLAAMVTAEAGMRAVNLGPDVPNAALQRAVIEVRPKLVWVSVSTPIAPARAGALARSLDALPKSITIVVGGRQSAELTLPERVHRASTMFELAAIARTIVG